MKQIITSIFIVFVGIICISGCAKHLKVEEYPNLLFNVDLTPGEDEKEIAIFFRCTKDNPTYEISEHGDKYLFLELNNTLKSMNVTDLNVEGLDGLIKTAKIHQIVQDKKPENPLITRIVLEEPDPELQLKLIFQVEEVEQRDVEKIVDSSQEAVQAIRMLGKAHVEPDYVLIAVSFWIIVILIVIIAYWSNQKKNR